MRARKEAYPVSAWLLPGASLATHPPASRGIPRIIHQTFSSRSRMPAVLEENCRAIEALNPDFTYRFYDDHDRERLIGEIYGEAILARYRRIDPAYGAARADLFRYLCIYHFGGVYLDVKVGVTRPLSDVLRDDDAYLLSQWDHSPGSPHAGWGTHRQLAAIPGGEFQQWHVIASPGHPFLAAVIAAVLSNIDRFDPFAFAHPWEAVICTTGPVAYTQSIHPILAAHPHRRLVGSEEVGLRYSLFDGSADPNAHRRLYRDYRKAETPLIRQPFPLSLLWPVLNLIRKVARRLRGLLRR
ncbi:mannosyltransferase OCH1-like enzyme [Cyanobium sp. Copco_Reservoir_LC18]|uniref:glycosyltransferase family 32 protein n=1 Tax=Cyanobium sp. Copco_Reservoir_LC18 TaxID=1328305 RepID=UPI00135CD9C2|nr:glycosyltransferase [Cyanobium sp. Copco_Reservoir_LC18]KAF0654327.1 mannosyltransferase OCH1-like enzyme [Cyanobium sp. Copco_Reservoir_LC18]